MRQSKQGKPLSQGRPASTERQLAQARELLAWYGPGTVQHTFAKSELERLARSGQEHGEDGNG